MSGYNHKIFIVYVSSVDLDPIWGKCTMVMNASCFVTKDGKKR